MHDPKRETYPAPCLWFYSSRAVRMIMLGTKEDFSCCSPGVLVVRGAVADDVYNPSVVMHG